MNLNQHQKLMNSSVSQMKMTNEYGLWIAKQYKVTTTYLAKEWILWDPGSDSASTEVNQEVPNSLQEDEVWQCLLSLKKETFFYSFDTVFCGR